VRTDDIFAIVEANPGFTGYQIWNAMVAQSKSAKWFGRGSLMTAIFGPSAGGIYVHLAKLEGAGRVRSHWGGATRIRGGHRPRHYYVVEQTGTST
jgi:DNA-binding PadR family transcriptional regulator